MPTFLDKNTTYWRSFKVTSSKRNYFCCYTFSLELSITRSNSCHSKTPESEISLVILLFKNVSHLMDIKVGHGCRAGANAFAGMAVCTDHKTSTYCRSRRGTERL